MTPDDDEDEDTDMGHPIPLTQDQRQTMPQAFLPRFAHRLSSSDEERSSMSCVSCHCACPD